MKQIEININDYNNINEQLNKQLPKKFKPKDNFINRLCLIVDKAIFRLSKAFILHFVRKYKFQKNKYKIVLMFKRFNIALFLFTILFASPLGYIIALKKDNLLNSTNLYFIFGLVTLPFLCITFFEVLSYLKTKAKAIDYDYMFLMQKHPQVYYAMKCKTKIEFEIDKKWRIRTVKARILVLLFLTFFFSLVILPGGIDLRDSILLPILLNFFIAILDEYVAYIFDFDKPSGKRKEAKKEITEMMKGAFEKLTRAMQPSASPI